MGLVSQAAEILERIPGVGGKDLFGGSCWEHFTSLEQAL